MSLEYEVKKPIDLSKININEIGELLWWSYNLSTSPEKILTTFDKVGNSAEAIRRAIKDTSLSSSSH